MNVLMRPRSKDGSLPIRKKGVGEPELTTAKAQYFARWRAHADLREHELEAMWAEQERRQAEARQTTAKTAQARSRGRVRPK